ncbi:MAG: AAA family ATPase [Myxococcota bacterium]
MLLRFTVQNFRSIYEPQALLMRASKLKDDPQPLSARIAGKDEQVLPTAGIFGANASGKSNLLKGLGLMRHMILHSHKDGEIEGRLPHEPFRLSPHAKHEPTRFELELFLSGTRYLYGFCYNTSQILEEWLYAYPTHARQVWFHRKHDEDPSFYFGKYLKGHNKRTEEITRKNSLFLSAAAMNNHEQLTTLYHALRDRLITAGMEDFPLSPRALDAYEQDDNLRVWATQFLRAAATGVMELQVVDSTPEVPERLRKEWETLREKLGKETHFETRQIQLTHRGQGQEPVAFETHLESRGTRTLLRLLGPVHQVLQQGGTLIVDELNSSLHPLLSTRLVQLFTNPTHNPHAAQLLFSTHDATLLRLSHLRRDSIWLTEKSREGMTQLIALSDFKVRAEADRETLYLHGHFGGVPWLTTEEDIWSPLHSHTSPKTEGA